MTTGRGPDPFDDDELIKAEFDSMVEGLSLDESAPTTYLDELDKFEEQNRFMPPIIPKRGIRDQIRDAKESFTRWKNNRQTFKEDDGSAI
ncbi:MAG: hypothetical protein RL130_1505 [Actinomycetota bacterium]|jgi:hypothetical protein